MTTTMADSSDDMSGWLSSPGESGKTVCNVCEHRCALRDGRRGLCGVRLAVDGRIVSLVYGRVVAEHVDPIEKKPLFHVLPGSASYSISTLGCNFRCRNCQNASISQISPSQDVQGSGVFRSPRAIVDAAAGSGCATISYTYVEPTVFFEFAYDCCLEAKARGLGNVFVSNGFMTERVRDELVSLLTAINIDLKSFSDSFYRKNCNGRLAPVLRNIEAFKAAGVWVEVTTLVIPGKNDSVEELTEIARFLAGLDPDIPWHVTGFYPAYRMSAVEPTGPALLERARKIGLECGLHHVYTGNRPGSGGEDSYCPSCGAAVIRRRGFAILSNDLVAGNCASCGSPVKGVW
jgi:pyruvate formate lyase activating enzyme